MVKLSQLLLFVLVLAWPPAALADRAAPSAAAAAPACGDFLAALGARPPGVEFVGCAAQPQQQGKPLRATYRVAGADAAAAEAFLSRVARLPRLKRSCCQWDGPPGHLRDKRGRRYTVVMVSVETDVTQRARWPTIEGFEIAVETPTEDI